MSDLLTVVVADDHPLFRKGVTDILRSDASIQVVGEAGDGDTALALIRQRRPRVAILDVDMPGRRGLDVAAELARAGDEVVVVLLTMYAGSEMLQHALSLGVRGYVSKESAVDDILACLHLVASGRTYVSVSLGVVPAAGPPAVREVAIRTLTPAERRVLKQIAANKMTRDIAHDLSISPKTVEHHRANICQKLGVTGNNALIRFCLEHAGELARL